jgi:hypothetical protein
LALALGEESYGEKGEKYEGEEFEGGFHEELLSFI